MYVCERMVFCVQSIHPSMYVRVGMALVDCSVSSNRAGRGEVGSRLRVRAICFVTVSYTVRVY